MKVDYAEENYVKIYSTKIDNLFKVLVTNQANNLTGIKMYVRPSVVFVCVLFFILFSVFCFRSSMQQECSTSFRIQFGPKNRFSASAFDRRRPLSRRLDF